MHVPLLLPMRLSTADPAEESCCPWCSPRDLPLQEMGGREVGEKEIGEIRGKKMGEIKGGKIRGGEIRGGDGGHG